MLIHLSCHIGTAEKLAGRVTGNPGMVERGQERKVRTSCPDIQGIFTNARTFAER